MVSFPKGPAVVLFDLDGTLTETEFLKARSYAFVARELCQCDKSDAFRVLDPSKYINPTVSEAVNRAEREGCWPAEDSAAQKCANTAMKIFMQNIGSTSQHVSEAMVQELGIARLLEPAMSRFGVSKPSEAFYMLRKERYYDSFATPTALREARYDHNIKMLRLAVASDLRVAVVTSSSTSDAKRVLEALDILQMVSFVVGADHVAKAKPDPEPYLKAMNQLGVTPDRVLIFEDSLNGVRAGVASGATVVAVSNPFTKETLQVQTTLPQSHVIYEPDRVPERVAEIISKSFKC